MRNATLACAIVVYATGCASPKVSYLYYGESDSSAIEAIESLERKIRDAEELGCHATSATISTAVGVGIGMGVGKGFHIVENCPTCSDLVSDDVITEKETLVISKYTTAAHVLCPNDVDLRGQ